MPRRTIRSRPGLRFVDVPGSPNPFRCVSTRRLLAQVREPAPDDRSVSSWIAAPSNTSYIETPAEPTACTGPLPRRVSVGQVRVGAWDNADHGDEATGVVDAIDQAVGAAPIIQGVRAAACRLFAGSPVVGRR